MTTRAPELAYFINERYNIHTRRVRGSPPPWTKDPILGMYRFTNVYRETDPVTGYIAAYLDSRNPDHLITFAALARYINNPATLQQVFAVRDWDYATILQALRAYRAGGNRAFNPAYIVSTNGVAMDKLDYVMGLVDRVHGHVPRFSTPTLASAAAELQTVHGVGSFMAGQIVADLKHTKLLRKAPDWWTWCTPGPGSRRGINKALGRAVPDREFNDAAYALYCDVKPKLELPSRLCMQNFQNCLCEFDKWTRAKDGAGRPKQLYIPAVLKQTH